jgi:hypothetical protein
MVLGQLRKMVPGQLRKSVNFEKDEVKTKKLKIYIYRLNKMLRIFLVSEEKKAC